jgi:hypothetical protein
LQHTHLICGDAGVVLVAESHWPTVFARAGALRAINRENNSMPKPRRKRAMIYGILRAGAVDQANPKVRALELRGNERAGECQSRCWYRLLIRRPSHLGSRRDRIGGFARQL